MRKRIAGWLRALARGLDRLARRMDAPRSRYPGTVVPSSYMERRRYPSCFM